MAITNIANPGQKYNTAYNQIVYVVDSDNKELNGFRYIFDVYSANTDTLLASYQIPPSITNGYGVFFAEKTLQNYLTYNFDTSVIRESHINYDVKVGESYGYNWNYTDYQFFSATGTTNNGYTQLYNTATTHNYSVGDQIFIVQSDEPDPLFPELSGLHTIRFVPDANSIIIDLVYEYVNIGVEISGNTSFANNSRLNYPDLYTYSSQTAINGAITTYKKKIFEQNYVMSATSTSRRFFTTAPDEIYKTENEDLFFNIINNKQTFAFYMLTQNDTGDAFRTTISNVDENMLQLKVGPNNVLTTTLVAGSFPLIKPTTKYYDVWVTNNSLQQVSKKMRIWIDRRCEIDYGVNSDGPITICFLDRFGSFGSFAFYLRRQDITNIERQTFNLQDGYINNGTWDFDMEVNGDNIYNVDLKRNITLHTNWLTEEEAQWFDELVTSPVTLIKLNDEYQRCIVKDTATEKTYQRNKRLMQKTITVQLSNNEIINI